MFKWICAFIGLSFRGLPGAFIGFAVGMVIDSFFGRNISTSHFRTRRSSGGGYQPFTGGAQRVSLGDFEVNLLSLASIVIKADGKVSQEELDYVRAFFVQTYGKERANATFRTFNRVVKQRQVEMTRVANYLRSRTNYHMRLQILHFLFGIAMADGKVMDSELNVLHQIAHYLGINAHDFESIKAMFLKTKAGDEAYKILEVDKDASEAEIKKAYRTMVKKYHPDRLTGMDEAYIKGARKKFEKVQEAYEKIRKERAF